MLLISFDFGTSNIGVAIGQQLTATARPLTSITAKNGKPYWNQIKKILLEWKPKIIIIGLPLNMDGTKQHITYQTEKFAKNIYTKFNITVHMHDERLSTREAKSILFYKHGFKSLKKKKIDAMSATLILESWLSNH
ncbi:MAG: Holliday junction resolvase RuvX [Buchnera aphidicola (Eriosoma harunire)]